MIPYTEPLDKCFDLLLSWEYQDDEGYNFLMESVVSRDQYRKCDEEQMKELLRLITMSLLMQADETINGDDDEDI